MFSEEDSCSNHCISMYIHCCIPSQGFISFVTGNKHQTWGYFGTSAFSDPKPNAWRLITLPKTNSKRHWKWAKYPKSGNETSSYSMVIHVQEIPVSFFGIFQPSTIHFQVLVILVSGYQALETHPPTWLGATVTTCLGFGGWLPSAWMDPWKWYVCLVATAT